MYFLYILLAVLVLLLVALSTTAIIEINYEYIGSKQKVEIILRIFKFIKIKIPVANRKKDNNAYNKKPEKKEKYSFAKIKTLFSNIKATFTDLKGEIFSLFASIKNHIKIDKILFEMQYGLKDAAKTGMANGAMWTLSSGVLSAVDNISPIGDVTLNIYPVFDRECFNARFQGIISFRLVHIISICVTILKIINGLIKIFKKTNENK